MSAEDILGLMVLATYLCFLATESLWPARASPPRRRWQWHNSGSLGQQPGQQPAYF